MNLKCKTAFDKTKKLIQERKSRLGISINPDIQNLDSGILLQFFENWSNYTKKYNEKEKFSIKKRPIDIINDESIIEEINLSYGGRNNILDYVPNHDKIFIMLDGKAIFEIAETGEKIYMNPFSVKIFKKNVKLNIYGKSDINYFITINFKSPVF